jgi:hypothetical protein
MKIKRTELLEQLESVTAGLSTHEIIAQSSCFVFKDKHVMTFNDEVFAKIPTILNITGAVHSVPFLNMLRKLKDDIISIEQQEKQLLIKGAKKRATFYMDDTITLPISSIETAAQWIKLPSEFSEAVALTKMSASKINEASALCCVHITEKYIESCDGYQAVKYKIKFPQKVNILVKADALSSIVSNNISDFAITKYWIHFKNDNGLILSCRKWELDYPDLSKIFDIKNETEFSLPEKIDSILEKTKIFSSESAEDDITYVTIKNGNVIIKGESVIGKYEEKRNVKDKNFNFSFSILTDLLERISKENTACKIMDKKIAVIADNYTYITVLICT